MNNEIILQSLTEAFEIIKDSWETKKEAIINCIVETEKYDGSLSMDMWLYILQSNESSFKDAEESKGYIYDVFQCFCKKNEEYGSLDRYACRAIMNHIVPHLIKNENLIDIIWGKTINAGYIAEDNRDEYIPMCLASILIIGNPHVISVLMESLAHNDNLVDISIGKFFLKADYFIREEIQHNHEVFPQDYKVPLMIKNALMENIDKIENKKERAECTIAFLSIK